MATCTAGLTRPLTLIKGQAAGGGRPRGGVVHRPPVVLIPGIDVGSKLHQDLDHLHPHVFGGVVQRGLVQPGSVHLSPCGQRSGGVTKPQQSLASSRPPLASLACVQQHSDTVDVVVGTGQVKRGPVVQVVRLQAGVHSNQQLHTLCISCTTAKKNAVTYVCVQGPTWGQRLPG